jgi:hypothetical protein
MLEPSGQCGEVDRDNDIRVFISYSHNDKASVEKIVEALHSNGIMPMWDQNFLYGHGFHDQIKTFISYSHVFLPLITEKSTKWVHQEIGYATALNIPVLPVAIGKSLPSEMIHELHALKLSENVQESLEELQNIFSKEVFETLVNNYRDGRYSVFRCAELHEERTLMMTDYANEITKLGYYGLVRQKGGLSSFHIPDKIITDPVWDKRHGSKKKSLFHCKLQRNERLVLTKHAEKAGCRLIISDGKYIETEYGRSGRLKGLIARKVRLETLLAFLENMPSDKVQIVIKDDLSPRGNLTIVGNWFVAESISGSLLEGYQQTIFNRHSPSIRYKTELFDQEFKDLLKDQPPESSRETAIKRIKEVITDLDESIKKRKENFVETRMNTELRISGGKE